MATNNYQRMKAALKLSKLLLLLKHLSGDDWKCEITNSFLTSTEHYLCSMGRYVLFLHLQFATHVNPVSFFADVSGL